MSTTNGQSSQVKNSSQGEEKTFLYDYTALDSFFRQEVLPADLAESFTRLHCGYTTLLAQAVSDGSFHNIPFSIPEGTTSLLHLLIEHFELIKKLEDQS